MRLTFPFLFFLWLWSAAVARGALPDHIGARDAFTTATVVVLGWEHVRNSPLPRELIDQTPDLVSSGVKTLLLETPSDYAAEFAGGDFSYLLQTTSGPRRYRIAQAFQKAGAAVVPGDADERWLGLNPLPLRKQNAAYKGVDEQWMRTRNSHFVDAIEAALQARPGKVLLLVGSAHADSIGKIALERGLRVRVINTSERNFGDSYGTNVLDAEDEMRDAQAVMDALDHSLDRELPRVHKTPECAVIASSAPWDVQKRQLAAWARTRIEAAAPSGRRAAQPLEIVVRELLRVQKEFPAQVQRAQQLAQQGAPRGALADLWNGIDAPTGERLTAYARKVAQESRLTLTQVQDAIPPALQKPTPPLASCLN